LGAPHRIHFVAFEIDRGAKLVLRHMKDLAVFR
jgi:hypothetical protein